MDPALWELLKTGGNEDAEEVEAIIRLDDPRVKIAGVRIVSRFGPIATCRLRKKSIIETRAEENVRSLKAPRLLGPEVEPEGLNTRLRLPHAVLPSDVRRPPGLSLTGTGVVVGIIDWGCDFDHPQFKHPDGSTRLLALWDQRGSPPPQARSYYGYGTVHSNRRINRALAGANPYRALGYHPADADSDGHGAHGTHVMDIAAGNGLGRGPMGVAPEADLIFVHLADRGTGGLANLGDSVRILEALDFVAKVAGPRPWVVNFSVGRHGGPHDGTTLAEMAFDFALQDASNCFLVQSTGNYSGKNIHSSGRLQTGQTRTLSLIVDEADTTPNELEIWYSGGDEFAVRIESPNGAISRWVKLGEQADVLENGRIVGRIYHRASDPNNSDNHLDLFLYVSAPPGVWKVSLKAERISSGGVFHTWLERDEACPGCQTRFSKFDSDNFYTTGTLANSRIPLVIGAYNTHSPTREVAAFSSVGPTRDHRPKPDLCAPGEGVLAARSSPRGASKSPGMFVRKSGTSMAAPHVTGAVALCLQGARRPLWSHEIRELILNNTEPAPASGRDVLRYGHGYLDVGRVVEAVLALPPRRKIAPVYSYAASEEHPFRSKERTMNGRRDEYFDRLEQVIKGTTSHAASERNLLAEILRASGVPLDSNAIDPDKLYQMLAFNRNGSLPAQIGESLTVLARPGEAPTGFPQAGDVLLRVALGEPGLGHLAVISDPTLWSHKQLTNAPFQPESQQPGFYATVIEGGVFPHTHEDRFARRILDEEGRMPLGQVLIRIKSSLNSEKFEENLSGLTEGEIIKEEHEFPLDEIVRDESASFVEEQSYSPVHVRILWPALGFPAVIAPKDPPSTSPFIEGDATRCICILLLSNRKFLPKNEAAKRLRYVTWRGRDRRYIPFGETGSFAEEEFDIRNDEDNRNLVWPNSKDSMVEHIVFGGNAEGKNSIRVGLANYVREFYRKQGLAHLHEIRIYEQASGRLQDGLYHLFWNNEDKNEKAPSDEMQLLINRFARPRRQRLSGFWQKKNFFDFLIGEYEYEYGALHPPYKSMFATRRPRAEVLHPLFVKRPASQSLKIGHLTDLHVDVRADVYEENLKKAPFQPSYNNWNKSFVKLYGGAKQSCDVLLLTGDLIDYGRGHWGPAAADRLGEDDLYHVDRNWFLFYYLLASGDTYQKPVYTILGNHDWRLNPYPPFAIAGAPSPKSMIHDYTRFTEDEQKTILQVAHGPGHTRMFSYYMESDDAFLKAFGESGKTLETFFRLLAQKRTLDEQHLPVETTVESVAWYLMVINPFLDYFFSLPGGYQILMLDWAEEEDLFFPIVQDGKQWPYMIWEVKTAAAPGPKAKNSLTVLQQRLVKDFITLKGTAKIIGIHAPLIGPYPDWTDYELLISRRTYDKKRGVRGPTNYATLRPDGSIEKWNGHPLFAIRPHGGAFGTEADYGSLVKNRPWFIKQLAMRNSGVRLVFSGHIHRNGLYVVYEPGKEQGRAVAGQMLIRGVIEPAVAGVKPPLVTKDKAITAEGNPGPLYVNTTSAGPRGNLYPNKDQYFAVDPGYAHVELLNDGTIKRVEFLPKKG